VHLYGENLAIAILQRIRTSNVSSPTCAVYPLLECSTLTQLLARTHSHPLCRQLDLRMLRSNMSYQQRDAVLVGIGAQ